MAVVKDDGSCPATDYMEKVRCKAKFEARFKRLGAFGWLRSPEHMRKIKDSDDVWEIKVSDGPGRRVYGCFEGNVFVITHGRNKPPDKKVAGEAKKARRTFEDWKKHEYAGRDE